MEEVVRYWEQSYGINPVALLFSIVITTVGMFAYVWWTTRPATHKEVRPEMLVLSFRAGDKVYIGEEREKEVESAPVGSPPCEE